MERTCFVLRYEGRTGEMTLLENRPFKVGELCSSFVEWRSPTAPATLCGQVCHEVSEEERVALQEPAQALYELMSRLKLEDGHWIIAHDLARWRQTREKELARYSQVRIGFGLLPRPTLNYECDSVATAALVDWAMTFSALSPIRRCKNCGEFFVHAHGNEEYCEREQKRVTRWRGVDYSEHGLPVTCRMMGPEVRYGTKLKTDPVTSGYRRAYGTRHAQYSQGRISKAEFDAWLTDAHDRKLKLDPLDPSSAQRYLSWLKESSIIRGKALERRRSRSKGRRTNAT